MTRQHTAHPGLGEGWGRRAVGFASWVYNCDGSLTLYLGHDSPGRELEPIWIPAPSKSFLAGLRMYGPSAKVQNDQWQMPAMKKAD